MGKLSWDGVGERIFETGVDMAFCTSWMNSDTAEAFRGTV